MKKITLIFLLFTQGCALATWKWHRVYIDEIDYYVYTSEKNDTLKITPNELSKTDVPEGYFCLGIVYYNHLNYEKNFINYNSNILNELQ